MPGAQVNLVTVAMAAVNQEPKESGEGWTSYFGEQDNTLTGEIQEDFCQFQGPI